MQQASSSALHRTEIPAGYLMRYRCHWSGVDIDFRWLRIDYYRIDLLMWIRRARIGRVLPSQAKEPRIGRAPALSAHDGRERRETQCGVRAPGG